MTDKDKKIIEDAEREGIPIMVFTAKDSLTSAVIYYYRFLCQIANCKDEHIDGVNGRLQEFDWWKDNNIDKVKLPD